MPYCLTTFHAITSEQVEEVLSMFTRENFARNRSAYALGNGWYSVDAGENDLRATFDSERETVKFFCRYAKELSRYDGKLRTFAAEHNIALQKS